MSTCVGVTNPGRVVQLILRSPAGEDLIVLDVLPSSALGAAGFQGITLGEDMEGLYRVPIEQTLKSWAYQEGATPSAYPRKKERRPQVNLHVDGGGDPAAYSQMEELLWTVLSTKWDCYLRVFDADDEEAWRELRVRLMKEPADKVRRMHGAVTHGMWPVELLACDPFWYSAPYEFEFTRDAVDDRPHMTAVAGGYEIDVPISNPTDQLGFIEWNSGVLTTAEQWSFQDGEAVDGVGAPVMIDLPVLQPDVVQAFWVQTYPTSMQLRVIAPSGPPSQQWARMRSRTFSKAIAANTPGPRTIRVRLVGGAAASTMLLTIPRRWDRPFGGELPIAAQMMVEA